MTTVKNRVTLPFSKGQKFGTFCIVVLKGLLCEWYPKISGPKIYHEFPRICTWYLPSLIIIGFKIMELRFFFRRPSLTIENSLFWRRRIRKRDDVREWVEFGEKELLCLILWSNLHKFHINFLYEKNHMCKLKWRKWSTQNSFA